MKIKLCGLTRLEDIDAVNTARPDFIGFVFAESRRQVSPERAAVLKSRLDGGIQAVGVFVDADIDGIVRLAREGVIELAQLHGNESDAYIDALKNRLDIPIIKAVRVQCAEQILAAEKLLCDYLLLDAYHQYEKGGTGTAFDHGLIPQLKKPFFLAGGLDLSNICAAAQLGPYCLDVSSGAETNGVKDAQKILEIVKTIREEC